MGRKLTLTPDAQTILEACFTKGLPVGTACRLAGVAKRSFYDWMRRGDQGEKPFSAFSDAIMKARAEGEEALVKIMHTHAAEDPGSAKWLLAIRNRKVYGQDAEGVDPVQESYGDATEDEIVELMASNPKVKAAVLAAVKGARKLGK